MADQHEIEGPGPEPKASGTDRAAEPAEPGAVGRVARPAGRKIKAIGTRMAAAADPMVDRIEHAIDAVERSIAERPGARVRRVRRMGGTPLLYLNDVHPGVRLARPVQVGQRTIPVEEITGTAVGGGDQRGGDFLPLRPFRGKNWMARWQRLKTAQDNLAILPPIEVMKHGGRYWVVDGHNRVGLALYAGQPEIDAEIVELVAPGERRSEPIMGLASSVAASRALRTAGEGHRPSEELAHEDRIAGEIERDE